MIRKILSVSLLLALLGSMLPFQVQADAESFQEIRNEFKAHPVGKKYISQIDRLLPRLSDEQLQETLYKVEDLYYWGEDVTEDQAMIFEYMLAAIENIQDQRNVVVHSSSVPAPEKAQAEAELLQAQKLLSDEMIETLKQSMIEWDTQSSYENKGNFSLDFDMDLEALGTVESGLKLNDYHLKTTLFDQQLTAEVDAFVNASIAGQDIAMQMQSLIDFITKDGNTYMLAEKLEVSLKNNELEEEFGDIIEKLKKLAETKTYLKIEDEVAAEAIKKLSDLTPESISSEIENQAKKPWFVVMEKRGSDYVLVPSKDLCSMMKQLTSVFDPFGGNTCSNTQYRYMLEDLEDSGIEFLYTPGNTAALRVNIDNEMMQGRVDLLWSQGKLISFTGQAVNALNPKKDKMSFSYFPRESFEILFSAEDANFLLHTSGNLSPTGTLESMKVKATADKMLLNMSYAQEKLSFDMSMRTYYDDIILCRGAGTLSLEYFDMNASCDISSMIIDEQIANSQGKLRLEMKASGDIRAGKNNYTLSLIGKTPSQEIFSLNMRDTGTRVLNPNLTITAPTKTVDIEELMGEIYESGY